MSRDKVALDFLNGLIDRYGLTHRKPEIERLLQKAILLKTTRASDIGMPLGHTKIGGLPDLPKEWEWPTFQGIPLGFLAQINLAQIPAEIDRGLLPTKGILYFFSLSGSYTKDDDLHPDIRWEDANLPGFSKVLYFDGQRSSLRRCSKPQNDILIFRAALVEFVSIFSFPRTTEWCRDPVADRLEWSEEEYNYWFNHLYSDFKHFYRSHLDEIFPWHQLNGYAHVIQSHVTKQDTQLLFQIDSDVKTGMEWGDGGIIYFTIRPSDLEQKDFVNIESDFQCG